MEKSNLNYNFKSQQKCTFNTESHQNHGFTRQMTTILYPIVSAMDDGCVYILITHDILYK